MSLQPGDIISTGTPPGVGMGQRSPVYLSTGNKVRLGIDGLGVQNQQVFADPLDRDLNKNALKEIER
jgi:2,4-diketo-3-deoxy-L-fuconate hydrolase